ncbi:Mbov_0121 family peptidase domain-containing ABC transporter [Mycoplasmopsis agassizii]|uniref:ABC transporter ATP-binding protein n=1 Tax=Mycoplasmopsis agassizii TaxID=33922 RepID=A0ABX4H5V6_9BACT|nr:cysteine peptidase family C39 domain-containing protein [Mycoplasmopsis agassizii]PAF55284.1 hypothetical protein CJF60_01175 [Mycoplasmopsis agassizii]SMC15702.1 putative ABC transport system ATP-binding protein [Mycoplasmopsis agassizii]
MEIVLQEDVKDCGLAVLDSFHNFFYDIHLDINLLKKQVNYGKQGISISELKNVASKYGLALESYKSNFQSLYKINSKEKYIALVQKQGIQHYVIIEKITKTKIHYLDPFDGKNIVSAVEFENIFLNILISVSIGIKKTNEVKINKSLFSELKVGKYFLFIFISILINSVFTFLSSFFLKLIFQSSAIDNNTETLLTIGLIFIWIIVIKVISNFLKNYLVNKSANNIEYTISKNFVNKILNINNLDYSKMDYYDYIRRSSLISQISNFKSKFLFALFSELLNFTLSTVILVWISYKLFFIALAASLIIFAISFVYQNLFSSKYRKILSTSMSLNSSTNDLIFSKKQLTNSKIKNHYLNIWNFNYLEYKNVEYKIGKLDQIRSLFSFIISYATPILLTVVGLIFNKQDEISLGNLLIFLTAFNFFILPFSSFSEIIVKYPLNKKNIELLNFVFSIDNEDTQDGIILTNKINNIKVEKLLFEYELNKKNLRLDNLEIDQSVILKGQNGSGKSTLLNLIAANYNTEEISINDVKMIHLNKDNYKQKIFHIYPEYFLTNTSIIDFITDGDFEKIKLFEENLQKYKITNILDNAKLNLKENLKDNGSSFSSGQKQIIKLLRIFTIKYELILLDEAFENIDIENIRLLKEAISEFQKDAIFIEISHNENYVNENAKVVYLEK